MFKLDNENYGNLQNLVKNLDVNCTFGYGVINNGLPGAVYVDNIENPASCLVTCDGGKYLVTGFEGNEEFNVPLVEFLKNEKKHRVYYDLYPSTDKWIELLSVRLKGQAIPLARTIYTYKAKEAPAYQNYKEALEEGYFIKRMNENLFDRVVKADETVLNQWGSAKEFLSKGFGFCIMKDDKIASICYTVVTGGGYAELSIMTSKDHRNKKLAFITGALFVEECINRKLIPIWDAGSDNAPSNQLAIKLGFTKAKETQLIFWHENRSVIQGYLDGVNFM